MDPARWARVQALFHDAADLPPAEQRAQLEARCEDDPTLIDEVLALLAEDARGDSMLDRDLGEVATGALADDARGTPPREIGPYRLREVLGEGGMGVVYLAERTDLKSLVAIKILRDAWLSPARRVRFAFEQRTLARLNHPCIARLYDADTLADGTPWFAMEYVDGMPLTRYCETLRSTRALLGLFRSVCEAVLHAHQLAVIHRDLKPSNILVTHGGQPKLLDFGIAKQLESLGPGADRTRTELRLMTPAYAAPEQLRGEDLGVHTDIYSLGAILYELLTRQPPFDAVELTPTALAHAVAERDPERPSVVVRRGGETSEIDRARLHERGSSWADLDVLCLTALQKDPARRYRTVDSMIRDIDHYLRGEPLEARPDTVGYRLGKFARRNWRPLTAAAVTLVAVVGLVTFYTLRLASARNTALAEVERTHRIQEFMNGLFSGGDDAAGPPESLRVVSLLDRGVDEARGLAAEPAIQSELYQTLGGIYQQLGNLDRADSLFGMVLAQRRARLGPDHPDVARTLVALSLLRADQSRFDEADSLARVGLAMSERYARADPVSFARATRALGIVLEGRGEHEQAIATLARAARLDSASAMPAKEVTSTLTELANSHFYAGHYDVADSLNRRILTIDRALYGERHPTVAGDLVNLGAVQQERGRWPDAERYYRQALDIYRSWYGENHFETAATLNMVGRALVQENRLADAREPLRRALAIRERIYGPVHPYVASTLNELALLAQREGRLDEAEADFRRMAAIYRTVYNDHHYLIGLAYSNLGGLFIERKDYRQAEQCFREALRRYATTLPEGHMYVGITDIKLGRALLREGRYADAEKESLAGYDIVAKQADMSSNFLQNARRDLVAAAVALKRPREADRFRAELEKAAADSAAAAH
jgi:serine/threonine-protein kinase